MKELFNVSELVPKIKTGQEITGNASISGLLKVNLVNFPREEIMNGFIEAINRANVRVITELKTALDDALRSNVWPSLSGLSDIYDTGELMESGHVTASSEGITITYDAPYAALVHYGGYILPYGNRNAAKVYLPARKWIDGVLNGGGPVKQFNFAPYYEEEIGRQFK